MLSDDQKRFVLDVARRAIFQQVTGEIHPVRLDGCALPDASGVFVTLKAAGALRGCLGTLECRGLEHDVARCAADAASVDPRFDAVTPDELAEIAIEVSVLGPLEEIDPADTAAIEVGRHGLVVQDGRNKGLLLPQVPVEWDWSRETFLRQTCVKAGLPGDAWTRGARVFRFEAEVFGG